jgi:hypothetical protein
MNFYWADPALTDLPAASAQRCSLPSIEPHPISLRRLGPGGHLEEYAAGLTTSHPVLHQRELLWARDPVHRISPGLSRELS